MLISAIRYESSEMPPDGRLPDHVVHDFEQWVAAGAVDPREATAKRTIVSGVDLEAGRGFWAFQGLQAAPPSPLAESEASGAIDAFLNDRLHAAGIEANKLATPTVQLRRLAFDLTGLPPSPALQSRWLADPSQRTWSAIADELLSSRQFAEHWARHWMDVARYADSNGSDFNATHHEAWRFRDYLIRSFAADRPFDQMIREQIAGDLLPYESDHQRHDNLVASTFLMLGTKMLSERDKEKLVMDVVDEQIDTVGRAFLGLTLGCARCHDHKFDPVPTEDYYALAGIFKSTVTLKGESQKYVSTWNRSELPTSELHRRELREHTKAVALLQEEQKQLEKELASIRDATVGAYGGMVIDDKHAEKVGNWKTSVYYPHFVGEGYVHDDNAGKGEASIRFATRLPESGTYEVRISHSPGSNRASKVPIVISTSAGDITIVADQRKVPISPMWSSLGKFEFSSDADASVTISNRGTSGYVIADAVQFLPDFDLEDEAPASDNFDQLKSVQSSLEGLKKRLEELRDSAPEPLPEAMGPTDQVTDLIADSHVHIRGEVKNLGPLVPRGFLQVCGPGDASIRSPSGSGRVELADWLTDPDNPLVSRVFVNRVWMHLMGEGLVRTVDNFGLQGDRPSHPELLDHLAIEFVRGGWHLKSIVRSVVRSRAYRRSSAFHEVSMARDPENRLLWRAHRRRLPAESIRDAMLFASGTLDPSPQYKPMQGRGVLVSSNNSDSVARFDDVSLPCRSIYLPTVRGYLPPLMTSLDVADPDLLVGRRPTTNVPGQALVLINSPEVNDWALATANRVMKDNSTYDERLRHAIWVCLQRETREGDVELAGRHFQGRKGSRKAWHQYIAAIFAGTEFRLLE